jgi:hypothetical protein
VARLAPRRHGEKHENGRVTAGEGRKPISHAAHNKWRNKSRIIRTSKEIASYQ